MLALAYIRLLVSSQTAEEKKMKNNHILEMEILTTMNLWGPCRGSFSLTTLLSHFADE